MVKLSTLLVTHSNRLCFLSVFLVFSQLRKRGVIVIKAVLDSRTVTEMEAELQNYLLDTTDQGLEPDIFW